MRSCAPAQHSCSARRPGRQARAWLRVSSSSCWSANCGCHSCWQSRKVAGCTSRHGMAGHACATPAAFPLPACMPSGALTWWVHHSSHPAANACHLLLPDLQVCSRALGASPLGRALCKASFTSCNRWGFVSCWQAASLRDSSHVCCAPAGCSCPLLLLTPVHFPPALQRIEEQRLAALLQEQQDAPVDVQVRAPWRTAAMASI